MPELKPEHLDMSSSIIPSEIRTFRDKIMATMPYTEMEHAQEEMQALFEQLAHDKKINLRDYQMYHFAFGSGKIGGPVDLPDRSMEIIVRGVYGKYAGRDKAQAAGA
jgi:hypothetical protein